MKKKFLLPWFFIIGSGILTASTYSTFFNKSYSAKFVDLFSESQDLRKVSSALGWDVFQEVQTKAKNANERKKLWDFFVNSIDLAVKQDTLKNIKDASKKKILEESIKNLKEKTNLSDDFYKKVERFSELAVQSNQKIEKLNNLNLEIDKNFENAHNKIGENIYKTSDFEKAKKIYLEIVELEEKIVEAKYFGENLNSDEIKKLKEKLLEKNQEQEKNFANSEITKYKNELKNAFDLSMEGYKITKLANLIYKNNIDISWKYGFVEPQKIKK